MVWQTWWWWKRSFYKKDVHSHPLFSTAIHSVDRGNATTQIRRARPGGKWNWSHSDFSKGVYFRKKVTSLNYLTMFVKFCSDKEVIGLSECCEASYPLQKKTKWFKNSFCGSWLWIPTSEKKDSYFVYKRCSKFSSTTRGEKVCLQCFKESGSYLMLRPKQNSICLVKDIISKFSSPGCCLMFQFSGTLGVAKTRFHFKKYNKFLKGEVDSSCIKIFYPTLLRIFAEQALCTESDVAREPGLETARWHYILFLHTEGRRPVLDRRSLFRGLNLVQTYPVTFCSICVCTT